MRGESGGFWRSHENFGPGARTGEQVQMRDSVLVSLGCNNENHRLCSLDSKHLFLTVSEAKF